MKRTRTCRTLWLKLLVAVSLWILLAGCAGDPEREQATAAVEPDNNSGAVAGNGERTVPVQVMELKPEPFLERLVVSGTLEPFEEVKVTTETGGLVRELLFQKGKRIRKGDLLCRVGDDLAEARLLQAEAELMGAEANFLKMTKLAERQAVPQQDLISATAVRDRLLARVRENQLLLERSRIHAPISGVALDRPVEAGEVLAPGAAVTTIQDVSRLKVVASVPDTEIRWLRKGGRGTLQVDAWPEAEFPVTISFLSPAADPESRTFLLELELDNRGGNLRPGMVSRVNLDRRSVEAGIVIPLDALVTRVEGPGAYIVEDCIASLRQVVIGAAERDRVLVSSGLGAGELLVVQGQRDLVNGQRVETGDCR